MSVSDFYSFCSYCLVQYSSVIYCDTETAHIVWHWQCNVC